MPDGETQRNLLVERDCVNSQWLRNNAWHVMACEATPALAYGQNICAYNINQDGDRCVAPMCLLILASKSCTRTNSDCYHDHNPHDVDNVALRTNAAARYSHPALTSWTLSTRPDS